MTRHCLLILTCCLIAAGPAAANDRFKIAVEESGVYRITHADLVAAGMTDGASPSASIGMTSRGVAVPVWVEDGRDGSFDDGDHVEFVAEHLRGEAGFYHDYTSLNVYWLDLEASSPLRPVAAAAAGGDCSRPTLVARRHLERDAIRARFPGKPDESQEVWYWKRLTYLDDPWGLNIDLPDFDRGAGRPVNVEIGVRGWSSLPRSEQDLPDHRLEVHLNGVSVTEDEWDNSREGHVIELRLPPALMREGGNELTVRVPRRNAEDGTGLVDMLLMNWIELSYPRSSEHFSGQDRVVFVDADSSCSELLASEDLTVWSGDGRWRAEAAGVPLGFPTDGRGAWVVPNNDLRSPVGIRLDLPSDLRSIDKRADYVIVAHARLIEAVRPLADFHRGRGLAVEVVDVADVYDEFDHGLETPDAIRSFLRYAHESWRRPAPRFALLVGDASWDTKNAEVDDENYADWTFRNGFRQGDASEFRKNESTPYAEKATLNHRNLIPAWQEITAQGHTASDNRFVAFDDASDRPSMAIGRFPVTEPAEVKAIVDKSIAYASRAPVGPWKTRALFITNEDERYQTRSDGFAEMISGNGWSTTKVYPASSETSNAENTEHLVEAIDSGQHIVHFLGHGGRYIWRTGPPDFRKNHDLFTLDDLERLAPNSKMSVVLSLSCYSAPFDHPNADSIGEKFLRLGDRGAVAVIAASWRNVPARAYSESLLLNLHRAETIGEAFLAAKQENDSPSFRDQYNLLGDPALPVQKPSFELALSPSPERPNAFLADLPADFTGTARIEWIGQRGEILGATEIAVASPRFEIPAPGDATDQIEHLRVYAWNEEAGVDGLGILDLHPATEPTTASTAGTMASGREGGVRR